MRRQRERWVTGVGLVGIGALLLALIWVSWVGLWASSWVWFYLALVVLVGLDLVAIAWLRGPLFEFARHQGGRAFVCRVAGGSVLDGALAIHKGDNAVANVIGGELIVYSADGQPVVGPCIVSVVEIVAVAGLVERKALRFSVGEVDIVLIPFARFGPLRDGALTVLRDAVHAEV